MQVNVDHVAGDSSHWRYVANPEHEQPPRGAKLSLLTCGGVQVTGEWQEGYGYIAWAPLIKRNKWLEKSLGIVI